MLYGRRRELAAPRQSAGMVARKPVCPRGQTGRSRGERSRCSVTFEVHRKIGIEFDLWMDTVTRSAHQAAEHGVCAGWKVCP